MFGASPLVLCTIWAVFQAACKQISVDAGFGCHVRATFHRVMHASGVRLSGHFKGFFRDELWYFMQLWDHLLAFSATIMATCRP